MSRKFALASLMLTLSLSACRTAQPSAPTAEVMTDGVRMAEAGVSAAGRVSAQAAGWELCGLRGNLCAGSSCASRGRHGSGHDASWVQACRNPSDGLYHCCAYSDRCGDTSNGCRGHGCGSVWCGGASGGYICSDVSCSGQGFKSAAAANCPARQHHYNCQNCTP